METRKKKTENIKAIQKNRKTTETSKQKLSSSAISKPHFTRTRLPPEQPFSAPETHNHKRKPLQNLHHPPPKPRPSSPNPKMAFEVEPASPSDAPQMARVFLAAFSDDFNKTMLPRTEDVRAWVTGHLVGGSGAKNHEVFLKINDAEGKIVAFAKWALPNAGPDPDPIPDSKEVSWPVSSDAELCDRFFGTMERYHHELMGERRHYCMLSLLLSYLSLLFISF